MTSALNERQGEDERADASGVGADDRQIDIIDAGQHDSNSPASAASAAFVSAVASGDGDKDAVQHDSSSPASATRPAFVSLVAGGNNGDKDTGQPGNNSWPASAARPTFVSIVANGDGDKDAGASEGETVVPRAPKIARDFLNVGGPDSDELRRLEESIRWLMDAGSMRLPQATPLSPVFGLAPPVDMQKNDSLILDPEALFPPRMPRRRGDIVREAAKILLVSAIAAPTAYFAASWMQFPGAAASSDMAAVSDSAVTPVPASVQVASLEPASEAGRTNAVATVMQPAAVQPTQVAPQHVEVALRPAERAVDTVVGVAPAPAVALDQPPSAIAPPPAVAAASVRNEAESVSAPIPAAVAPPKPGLRPAEIAMMIERGRTLFDSGDLVAARLFFRRAANAGDSSAAIAMGATYDPDVLAQRFIRGIEGDSQEAQKWYDKARSLGGTGTRIEMLAHR